MNSRCCLGVWEVREYYRRLCLRIAFCDDSSLLSFLAPTFIINIIFYKI